MGKRGQGEGTIGQRADGRWEAMYTYRDALGDPKRRSLYAKTQKEASQKLRAVLRSLDQGQAPITDNQTVAQFLNHWLEDSVQPARAPKTADSYAGIVRRHIVPALGQHQLAKLTPQHVQALLSKKSASGASSLI